MLQPPPAPRDFPLSAAPFTVRFLLLFGGIWALVGTLVGGAFIAAGGGPWNDWLLDSRGVTSDATLVTARATNARVNGLTRYDLTLRAEATELHVSTTDLELLDAAKAGAPVRVQWDPVDPSRARLEGERASFFGLFILLPGFFAVTGWALVLGALSRLLRLRSIYRHGEPALAVIRSVEGTSMRENERPVYRAHYEFRAGMHGAHGSYTTVRPPAVGNELWVLYAPNDAAKNLPFTSA